MLQQYRPQGFKTPLVPLSCTFCIFAAIFLIGSAGWEANYRFGIVLGVSLVSARLPATNCIATGQRCSLHPSLGSAKSSVPSVPSVLSALCVCKQAVMTVAIMAAAACFAAWLNAANCTHHQGIDQSWPLMDDS